MTRITIGRTGKPIYWGCQSCGKEKTTYSQRTKPLCRVCGNTTHNDSKTTFYTIWNKFRTEMPYEQFKDLFKESYDAGLVISLVDGRLVARELADATRTASTMRRNNTTGYTGCFEDKRRNTFYWQIQQKDLPTITVSGFETVEAAAIDRNNRIESDHIIAKLNVITT